jgi:hypothetical protein
MMNFRIVLAITMAVVALSIVSFSVVFAARDDGNNEVVQKKLFVLAPDNQVPEEEATAKLKALYVKKDGKAHWGSMKKKLAAMVENGDITEEEATAKLKALYVKKGE